MATISKWHRTATIGLKFGGRLLNSSICRDKDEWPILRYFLSGLPLLIIPRQAWPDFEFWAIQHEGLNSNPALLSILNAGVLLNDDPFEAWELTAKQKIWETGLIWVGQTLPSGERISKALPDFSTLRTSYTFLSFWNSRLLVFDRTRNKKCFWYCAINIEGKILSCCKR